MSINSLSGFTYAEPETLGISSRSILRFLKSLKKHSVELHRFAIMRYDKIAASCSSFPYQDDIPHIMFSFSKSLTSTAIGFAIQEGLLRLDEKLVDIFPEKCPENISDNLKKCDIHSLLTMTCGQEKEVLWDFTLPEMDPDWIGAFFRSDFPYEPGTTYLYNTSGTNLLSAVIQRKTGLSLTAYLKPRLFEPLGMSDVRCVVLPDGTEMGGAGMSLTLKDMLLFSCFLLHRGVYNGKRLLQDSWFDLAITKQVETVSALNNPVDEDWRVGYGYQFWMCQKEGVYRADGAYGQFSFIDPKNELIVTINTLSQAAGRVCESLWNTIYPELSDIPLPEDPEGLQELKEYMAAPLPALFALRSGAGEDLLSGRVFHPTDVLPAFRTVVGGTGIVTFSSGVLKSLSFSFSDFSVTLTLTEEDGKKEITAFFDGEWNIQQLDGRPYAVTAAWENPDSLCLILRELHAASGARVYFDRTPEGLTLRRYNLLNGGRIIGHTILDSWDRTCFFTEKELK